MALNREKVIRTAEKYVSKGKLENAINEYKKVLKEDRNDANTLNRVGDLYARLDRKDEAVRLFSQIAERYTNDGFYVKAIAIYKKIIKLDPTVLQVYERLAELYHKQGLINEARTQYQVLADYYQKHQNTTSATTIYQRMVEMEPDNPSYHLKLAELYQSQKLTDKALRSYRQLADLLMVNGSVEEASQVYLRALEVGADDLEFVREAVGGLHHGGSAGAAAKVLARAVELNPAAAAIEREIGMGESAPALDETAVDATIPEMAAEVAGGGDDAFDIEIEDETFAVDVEDVSFDTAEPERPPGKAGPVDLEDARSALSSETLDDDESVAFDISLEEDDLSGSMVAPPDDMDSTGSAFRREDEEEIDWSSPEDDGDGEIELELELPDDDSFDIEVEMDAEAGVELDAEPAFEPEPEPELEPEPETPVHRLEDLLDEAKVFSKYGLKEKARTRVDQLLEDFPDHPDGLCLRAEMALEDGELDRAFDLARKVESAVFEGREVESWGSLLAQLAEQGFVSAAPPPKPVVVVEEAPPEADESMGFAPDLAFPDDIGFEDEVVEVSEVEPAAAEVPEPVDDLGTGPVDEMLLDEVDLDAGPLPMDVELDDEPIAVSIDDEPIVAVSLDEEDLAPVVEAPAPEPAPTPEVTAVEAPAPEPAPEAELPPEPPAQPVGVSTASRKRQKRISKLLDDLDLDGLGLSKPSKAKKTPSVSVPPDPEQEPAAAPAASPPPFPAPPAAPPPAAAPPAEPRAKVSLVDELALDELDEELGGVFAEARARATGSTESVTTGETPAAPPAAEMSWLDEPAEGSDAPAAVSTDSLFDDEDDFFDLASELEKELSDDDMEDEPELVVNQEQSLEEIIDGFKKGVAENLSPEDYDTHFNLGIAYREMGLVDEAIGEFQLASKDERYLVDSSSMLGMCFLEKGLPELAIRWYRKGLESPTIEEDKVLGLLYEMGNTYVTVGDEQSAYKTFAEIYGISSTFRDVSTRMEELRAAAQ